MTYMTVLALIVSGVLCYFDGFLDVRRSVLDIELYLID